MFSTKKAEETERLIAQSREALKEMDELVDQLNGYIDRLETEGKPTDKTKENDGRR